MLIGSYAQLCSTDTAGTFSGIFSRAWAAVLLGFSSLLNMHGLIFCSVLMPVPGTESPLHYCTTTDRKNIHKNNLREFATKIKKIIQIEGKLNTEALLYINNQLLYCCYIRNQESFLNTHLIWGRKLFIYIKMMEEQYVF